MGSPAEDPEVAPDAEGEDDDGQYAERSEIALVQEWYCRERILFEQKALEAIEEFKKVPRPPPGPEATAQPRPCCFRGSAICCDFARKRRR